MRRNFPIDVLCKYKGTNEFYKGTFFSKGVVYLIRYIYTDPETEWDYYLINDAMIPYTPNGFKEVWEVIEEWDTTGDTK